MPYKDNFKLADVVKKNSWSDITVEPLSRNLPRQQPPSYERPANFTLGSPLRIEHEVIENGMNSTQFQYIHVYSYMYM